MVPQGTLLGLMLFIVLINVVGFAEINNNEFKSYRKNLESLNRLHLKYVDDFTVLEAINMKKSLINVPDRPRPDQFHARTGHHLPTENSEVYNQLLRTKEYADANDMKINAKKTKLMIFNPCVSKDFQPDFNLEGKDLECVDETKLLGVVVRTDLKWHSNTETMVKKAFKKLWMLKRLQNLGASTSDLIEVYTKQIRSLVEIAVPVWQGAITRIERNSIERVQKCALHIILGNHYVSYKKALETLKLEDLETRRQNICLNFALKATKSDKFSKWFTKNKKTNTRHKKEYYEHFTRCERFKKSPLNHLTKVLNEHFSKMKLRS